MQFHFTVDTLRETNLLSLLPICFYPLVYSSPGEYGVLGVFGVFEIYLFIYITFFSYLSRGTCWVLVGYLGYLPVLCLEIPHIPQIPLIPLIPQIPPYLRSNIYTPLPTLFTFPSCKNDASVLLIYFKSLPVIAEISPGPKPVAESFNTS